MLNWKYYLLWIIILPVYFLDVVLHGTIGYRSWQDCGWIGKILVWHDNTYRWK